jgi:hypothetical protein
MTTQLIPPVPLVLETAGEPNPTVLYNVTWQQLE